MTTRKTNGRKPTLIGVQATGFGLKGPEEFQVAYGTVAGLLYPSGLWEAESYYLIESPELPVPLDLPGKATLRVQVLGSVDTEFWSTLQLTLTKFRADFYDKVLEPLLELWGAYAGALDLQVDYADFCRARDYIVWIDKCFADWLPLVASSDWGRKQIERSSGLRGIKGWYTDKLEYFIQNDVRVNLGNELLAEDIKRAFHSLVQENNLLDD